MALKAVCYTCVQMASCNCTRTHEPHVWPLPVVQLVILIQIWQLLVRLDSEN